MICLKQWLTQFKDQRRLLSNRILKRPRQQGVNRQASQKKGQKFLQEALNSSKSLIHLDNLKEGLNQKNNKRSNHRQDSQKRRKLMTLSTKCSKKYNSWNNINLKANTQSTILCPRQRTYISSTSKRSALNWKICHLWIRVHQTALDSKSNYFYLNLQHQSSSLTARFLLLVALNQTN